MGCCCSSDNQNIKSSSNNKNIVDSKPQLPDDLNLWTQEDCDTYSKDEALFEDELEFTKSEIVMNFHTELNLFLSILKQKLEEDAQKRKEEENEGEEEKDDKQQEPSPMKKQKSRPFKHHHFHINSKEATAEQKLVDVERIQKMFTVAVAFGRFADAKMIYNHYEENVKPGDFEDDGENEEGKKKITNSNNNINFDINAPLKPFFPYNGRVYQWNPLQWCIAIQTQRHLNEHFHDKSERLSFLKKDRGDFVLHETSREEQNTVVSGFVDFLLNTCGADVNCDDTRRSYEKLGRLVPLPPHMLASQQKIEKEMNEKKHEKDSVETNYGENEPFSPPAPTTTTATTAASQDPRLNLQHDSQDYCHRDHPLFLAVEATNDLAVTLLSNVQNCVINPFNKNKDTPLAHFCDTFRIYNSHSLERAQNIVKCLIDHCADVNHENLDDTKTNFASVTTALDFAVIHGHVEIASMLVELGKANWKKTHGKLTSLLEEYLKWNYGTRENAIRMRKYFKELSVKNAMSTFAQDVSEGKVSGSDVASPTRKPSGKRLKEKEQKSKQLASP